MTDLTLSDLTGRRALVTGGSRGIGAAIARALARGGADVAITYATSPDRAAAVMREIEALGRRAVAFEADSADPDAVQRSVASAVQALGGLDILVNNAGIARMGPIEELSLDDIDALLHVNIRAVLLAARAAIPHLPAGGRIITVGSNVSERVPFPGIAAYSMTKSALTSLTRGLARDLGPRGINVTMVHPGATDTDMNPADGDLADTLRGLTPLGRYGTPEDVAAAVVFLAGPGGRQVTGTGLVVDGGMNA